MASRDLRAHGIHQQSCRGGRSGQALSSNPFAPSSDQARDGVEWKRPDGALTRQGDGDVERVGALGPL